MALLAQSVAIRRRQLFALPASHPWETRESSTRDLKELFAPDRERAFPPCQDFSCAMRCRFLPTSRSRRGVSFCVRQISRTPPVRRNIVQQAARAPCVLHQHISRQLLREL